MHICDANAMQIDVLCQGFVEVMDLSGDFCVTKPSENEKHEPEHEKQGTTRRLWSDNTNLTIRRWKTGTYMLLLFRLLPV